MHLASKKIWQRKTIGIEGKRLQEKFLLGGESKRRRRIYFNLDFDFSVAPQMDVVLGRIAFQESGLDRTLRRLFLVVILMLCPKAANSVIMASK